MSCHRGCCSRTSEPGGEAGDFTNFAGAINLPWRHTVSLSGAFSETDGIVDEPFSLEGESWQIGLNYRVPLDAAWRGRLSHGFSVGLDLKSSTNNFDYADIPITDNRTTVVQARIGYNGSLSDSLGVTTFNASIVISPGGIGDRNEDAVFAQSRAGATADYVYARLGVNRIFRFTGKLEGWEWQLRGEAQTASENLLGSEQFNVGVAGTVRGYDESEDAGDHGLLGSQEFVTPAISHGSGGSNRGQVRVFFFQDVSRTDSVNELPGEAATTLHSAGLGLRLQVGRQFNAQFAYGWQIQEIANQSGRAHFSLRATF